tara:strand:- start:265 stop:609 length:345 start_codon:yes stop_codon:yes gene_type:complete
LGNELEKNKCIACNEDAEILTDEEIKNFKQQVPSWIVEEGDNVKKLICSFSFLNYEESVKFTNKIASLAEEEDHHPEIRLEWGKVTVIWWTHKIKGLHKNDFICAKKTDLLFES